MSNYFNIKKLWADTKKVITITTCGLLLIANIVVFAYLSTATMLPSFIFIIISCIISIFLTAIIYKPISKIIDEEVQNRLNDEHSAQKQLLDEKAELENKVRFQEQKAQEREQEIKRLESELDTAKQYKSISNNANLVLKLEQMEYEKEGYIVKEEYVRDNVYGQDIKKSSPWLLQFADKGEQKVLYIKKFHEKALIGIDLSKVRFCRHEGDIYLEGIKVSNLHPEMTVPTEEAIDHCLILNTENNGKEVHSLNTDKKYEDFKLWYSKQQEDIFNIDFKSEVTQICAQYTAVLRQNLCNKFPSLHFVDGSIENVVSLQNEPIMSLNLNKDFDILEVSSSIMMIANTMNQTMPIARR
ncbi:MAG: hypothetical protein MJZ61_03765 [Bacteroidales bacterium]|nr:hypothetical protein [Bacteroidales bacterium]